MVQISAAGQDRANDVARVAAEAGMTIDQRGSGRPVLLLHGGGGPVSVSAFADDLSRRYHVVAPTHAGFAGTARPAEIGTVKDLAHRYLTLLERSGLEDVLAIGCSIGGWIAAEMAASGSRRLAGLVLVDAVGIAVPGQAVLDVFSIAPQDLASFSFHAPERYRIDPTTMTAQQAAAMRANFATLAVYGRAQNMQDPDLRERLATVQVPALVVWGESDRVVWPEYGRSFANAFPQGRFEMISACGHLPQIEQPAKLLELVEDFAAGL